MAKASIACDHPVFIEDPTALAKLLVDCSRRKAKLAMPNAVVVQLR